MDPTEFGEIELLSLLNVVSWYFLLIRWLDFNLNFLALKGITKFHCTDYRSVNCQTNTLLGLWKMITQHFCLVFAILTIFSAWRSSCSFSPDFQWNFVLLLSKPESNLNKFCLKDFLLLSAIVFTEISVSLMRDFWFFI